jgi:N-acetylneuraminate synthase
MIEGLRRAYPELVVGYSDHTLPDPSMAVLTTAYLKGARIIEKHFTHDKTLPGNDHYHAMDMRDLRKFREQLGFIRRVLGQSHKAPLPEEQIARDHARRSLVLKKAVAAGEALTDAVLTYKRPGTGISPLHWDEVIGRKAACDLEEDHLLQWQDMAAANADVEAANHEQNHCHHSSADEFRAPARQGRDARCRLAAPANDRDPGAPGAGRRARRRCHQHASQR